MYDHDELMITGYRDHLKKILECLKAQHAEHIKVTGISNTFSYQSGCKTTETMEKVCLRK